MFNNHSPIYLQIVDRIEKEISSRELLPGAQLPAVRALASTLKVNPNTVQKAYQEIESRGLCRTERGVGRFITEDREKIERLRREMARQEILHFLQAMKALGYSRAEILQVLEENELWENIK